ncbi:ICP22 family protein [Mycolicibacterium helvum]|uniref:Uncharacterized protein n=1 Tax=Mycolicibacterium helvum TaxID=1534349 RepID=A0A7I7T4C8_9MYCO|nr:hypothetical protein [Mycolicibacterium helvum]BBY63319.1 hypothetical protein MHEL_15620 [Mycolicibacterium helvum]
MRSANATRSRKAAGFTAAVTVSLASLFAGVPVSAADPYDDDSGSSYDGGGGAAEPSGGGQEAPDPGAGQEAPGAGGVGQEAPDQGSGQDAPGESVGGGQDQPSDDSGSAHDDGTHQHDDGGAHEGGGNQETPDGGGGTQTPPAGGATMAPTELDAPAPDVTAATSSSTTQVNTSSSSQEVSTYQQSLTSTVSTSTLSTTLALSSPVSQWNSSWLSYDRYYRPIFTNPYRIPLQVIYDYGGGPQTFTVPPLQRAVIDVPNAGVYSFTAATKPASGPPTNVSVGSFSGGGFQPAPGQAPPEKPARLNTTKNALVQIKYTRGASEPFRVSALTDLGKDPAAKDTTKVLLDEEIPAWGEWSKTAAGEAVFVVSQTQLLPGVKRPGQDPLPGYNIKLAASEESTSWMSKNRTVLIVSAIGVLALAAAVALIVIPRRRRTTDR